MGARVLVVDDSSRNVKLLTELLDAEGYSTIGVKSGEEALKSIEQDRPDLVLLDVMMPGMNGYEVCRAIRANPHSGLLPVVMVTALDPEERVNGLKAGADDFLSKPINQPELFARVASLLRIKTLYDEVQKQRAELENWNRTLEHRVEEGVAELERLSRLKRFFSPQVADVILSAGADDPLRSHRAEITVVFIDLRDFTAFTDTADPEEVMAVLRDYHACMGRIALSHQGTIERFVGDGIMILFNDPVPVPNPAESAVRMALEMRTEFAELADAWSKRGHALKLGMGIALGYATLGAMGFEGRREYGAVGTVCNMASRLCGEAKGGQILVTRRVLGAIENLVVADSAGELTLKGFQRPIPAFNIRALK